LRIVIITLQFCRQRRHGQEVAKVAILQLEISDRRTWVLKYFLSLPLTFRKMENLQPQILHCGQKDHFSQTAQNLGDGNCPTLNPTPCLPRRHGAS